MGDLTFLKPDIDIGSVVDVKYERILLIKVNREIQQQLAKAIGSYVNFDKKLVEESGKFDFHLALINDFACKILSIGLS